MAADAADADAPWLPREALIAEFYGLGAIVLQGVLPGGGISILSHGAFYLLTLRFAWAIPQALSKSTGWHQQNSGC